MGCAATNVPKVDLRTLKYLNNFTHIGFGYKDKFFFAFRKCTFVWTFSDHVNLF